MPSSPPWSPTQQVRALLLLHELAALLADEARLRTAHGNRNLVEALAAVGKRGLPQAIHDIATWPALRLVGARDALRAAIQQHASTDAWAERTCEQAIMLLKQGDRFTDAGHRLDQLARAVAAVDASHVPRLFEQQIACMHKHRCDHVAEDPAATAIWTQAIALVVKTAASLGVVLAAPEPSAPPPPPPGPVQGSNRVHTASSTPYQPGSISDPGSDAGGTRALRRRAAGR